MATQQPLPRRKRFIPKYEVEGVSKLVLGEETQMQIEMVIGTHINAQNPWKFVEKEKIIESIDLNGEASEFFNLRELLNDYTEELVLMGYIVDESKDVDEFYVCLTTEARDHCKQQSDKFIKRQQKKLEKAILKKPMPWKSLGSETEIIELIPINSRPLLEIEIKAKFPKYYEPKKFNIRDTNSVRDGYIELTPYRQKFNNIFRQRVDCASQAAPSTVQRHAQTELRYPQNVWTQSIADALGKVTITDTEAGGDAGQDKRDEDQLKENESSDEDDEEFKEPPDEVGLQAYRNAFRRMRRPSYVKMINNFMKDKVTDMGSIIELNTVMDMYCNDYPNLIAEKAIDIYDTMTFEEYVCFTDIRAKDKYISSAVFHPMWSGIVAICYSDGSPNAMKTLGSHPDPIQRAVYGINPVLIWSHIDTLIPKLTLEASREVKVLSFCPFDENILIGGCINGQVIIWDIANKLENVDRIEVLSETREKYRIAMNAHMGWMKNVQDKSIVQCTALSNLMTSHYGAITAINWLSPNFNVTTTGKCMMLADSKKSMMFFTGSEDGSILIWSLSVENVSQFEGKKVKKSKRVLIRPPGLLVDYSPYKVFDRTLQPCYKIHVGVAGRPQTLPLQSFGMNPPVIKYTYAPRKTGTGRKYFTSEIIPQSESEINTILYCGSQHGELARITWEGHEFNTGEVVNSEYCDIMFSCHIHDGAVTRTQKNPFISHMTLTIGGKIFAIWSDKLKNRPIIWKKRPCRLTDGAWSQYKPSLLFVTTSEGDLETWDLLARSDQPISVQTLSGMMLTSVSLHTLPLAKNIIGVSDINGAFRMFLYPPIFMIENPAYIGRTENMINRELKVMNTFIEWQEEWMRNNPEILLEIRRKEGELLALKEEEKRRQREEEERKLEEEAEAKRQQKLKVIGPEERWQMIIQKLIEKTIAVKKRINRAELIEQEKPLRELEAQRLEKERRMLEIMKNQKSIFNDTVAILFPEAIKKEAKVKKSYLGDDKNSLKITYLEEYESLKDTASRTVQEHPYKIAFSWENTLAEGKERRLALNAHEEFIKMHICRLDKDGGETPIKPTIQNFLSEKEETEAEAGNTDG
ncbi:dynein axonemal intermediate chain 3 [Maniola jurtina]|uniref:dynein axonemal intermediate chain 3 n=1 Tax=Maniola jurtina TaxID=191418 RepID=UPI001E68CD7E|nr:dynein axonemal intermediate chain 3 [Maniola jurtina]